MRRVLVTELHQSFICFRQLRIELFPFLQMICSCGMCFTLCRGVSPIEVGVCVCVKTKKKVCALYHCSAPGSVSRGNSFRLLTSFSSSLSLGLSFSGSFSLVPAALDVFVSPRRTAETGVARLVSVHWT